MMQLNKGKKRTECILLFRYELIYSKDIFFVPEPKKNSKHRVWDIKQVKTDLGSFTCKNILFLHSLLGCDTTSRLYGIGKGTSLKKFKGNVVLQQAARCFDSPHLTHAQIQSAGENSLIVKYNGKQNKLLNDLCHRKYCEKIATSNTHVD